MNVQIFGIKKSFDTKAAERFFKERQIKYQFIDLNEKSMSKRELESVINYIKDIDLLFDESSPLYEEYNVKYILRTPEYKKELLLEHPKLMKMPVVRECQSGKATVGKAENIWKSWLK